MKTILRNFLAILAGFFAGSAVNMALILASPHVIPPPPGVDASNMESMKAAMHLYQPMHFLFPFLAHALGTFAGALAAYFIAATRRTALVAAVGVLFLAGGIAACVMIPAPAWFIAVDLLAAYLPMAWLGLCLGRRLTGQRPGNGG